ncbi:hypothetical protein GGI11_000361 [Coemansia sp. RSA 2049]|nr:hypothetical protein GGI11_000361 [Coemansia sp. RSA 2049]
MTIKIGLPEHFSAPLFYAEEKGEFKELDVEFMVARLASGELDIAICVTEGLVAGIGNNRDAGMALIGTYVDSALPWAISVAADAKYSTIDDLAFGARFGVSRAGSGSDVMAKYTASAYEWKHMPTTVVLGDVAGLVGGTQEGRADAFMWERTTMQRYYDSGAVRYLGTVRPPWPAFSLGARAQFLSDNAERVKSLLATIGRVARAFMADAFASQRTEYVCDTLGYAPDDVRQWAGYVRYSGAGDVDESKIQAAIGALVRAGVMEQCQVSDVVRRP